MPVGTAPPPRPRSGAPVIAMRAVLLLAFGVASAHPGAGTARPAARSGLSVTYLANEGVLLSATDSAGTRKVLIDALFEPYDDYAVPPDTTQAALRRASAPYDAVDLILVTHRHGDHFHPAPAADHLRANPRAVLVTSRQVIDSLRGRVGPELLRSERIVARTLPPGARRSLLVNGVPVHLLGLPHGGERHRHVEHLAYVVDLGGRRVLHVGDAELSEATLAPLRIDTMQIDVALVPYWALTDEDTRRIVERWIRPRNVAAFHLGDGDARTARSLRSAMPGAHVFQLPLERVEW